MVAAGDFDAAKAHVQRIHDDLSGDASVRKQIFSFLKDEIVGDVKGEADKLLKFLN